MPDLSPPSRNPTVDDSLIGTFKLVLRKFLQGMDDMLPAVVVAYDKANNTAQVQPLITMVTTNQTIVKRAHVMSVPVYIFGAGNMLMRCCPVAGDLGWIKANDRDISIFKQSFTESQPNTGRLHSFEDALFFPDKLAGVTVPSNHINDATIQTPDGSSYAALMTHNAVMDLGSTTKAFKLMRMTRAQRNAIPSPEGGMMVYVTDAPPGFSFYTDGTGWS